MSRTVRSPGGDEVLLLDDEDFAELLGVERPSRAFSQVIHPGSVRIAALGALWYSGPVEDRSGLAMARLQELATALDPRGMAAGRTMRSVLDARPVRLCWEAEVRGKRTYRIQLVGLPERWLDPILTYATTAEKEPETVPDPPPERGPGVEPVETRSACHAPPPSTGSAPLPEGLADAVATSLLARVVEALATGPGSPQAASELATLRRDLDIVRGELEASLRRQATAQEYASRLRRELDEARDRVVTLTDERDGLRQRLRATEHNLSVATSPAARKVIDEEVRKELAKVMRATPTARSVYDEEEGA